MNFIKLIPVILSMLLLGAHFFRYGNFVMVLGAVFIPCILFIRRPWAVRLIQVVLILGGLEWIRTLISLAMMRQAMGAPWERLAVVIGGVAMFTICSAFVFRSRTLRERYHLSSKKE